MKKVLLTAGFLAGIGVVLAATTSGASSDFASVGQRAGFNEASSRIKTIFPEMVDEAKLKEKVIAAGCVGKSKADIISKTHELAAEMAFEISLLEAVRQEYSLSHLAEGEDSEVNEDTKEVLRTAVPGYKGLISSITSMASLNDVTRAVIEAVKQNYQIQSTEDAEEGYYVVPESHPSVAVHSDDHQEGAKQRLVSYMESEVDRVVESLNKTLEELGLSKSHFRDGLVKQISEFAREKKETIQQANDWNDAQASEWVKGGGADDWLQKEVRDEGDKLIGSLKQEVAEFKVEHARNLKKEAVAAPAPAPVAAPAPAPVAAPAPAPASVVVETPALKTIVFPGVLAGVTHQIDQLRKSASVEAPAPAPVAAPAPAPAPSRSILKRAVNSSNPAPVAEPSELDRKFAALTSRKASVATSEGTATSLHVGDVEPSTGKSVYEVGSFTSVLKRAVNSSNPAPVAAPSELDLVLTSRRASVTTSEGTASLLAEDVESSALVAGAAVTKGSVQGEHKDATSEAGDGFSSLRGSSVHSEDEDAMSEADAGGSSVSRPREVAPSDDLVVEDNPGLLTVESVKASLNKIEERKLPLVEKLQELRGISTMLEQALEKDNPYQEVLDSGLELSGSLNSVKQQIANTNREIETLTEQKHRLEGLYTAAKNKTLEGVAGIKTTNLREGLSELSDAVSLNAESRDKLLESLNVVNTAFEAFFRALTEDVAALPNVREFEQEQQRVKEIKSVMDQTQIRLEDLEKSKAEEVRTETVIEKKLEELQEDYQKAVQFLSEKRALEDLRGQINQSIRDQEIGEYDRLKTSFYTDRTLAATKDADDFQWELKLEQAIGSGTKYLSFLHTLLKTDTVEDGNEDLRKEVVITGRVLKQLERTLTVLREDREANLQEMITSRAAKSSSHTTAPAPVAVAAPVSVPTPVAVAAPVSSSVMEVSSTQASFHGGFVNPSQQYGYGPSMPMPQQWTPMPQQWTPMPQQWTTMPGMPGAAPAYGPSNLAAPSSMMTVELGMPAGTSATYPAAGSRATRGSDPFSSSLFGRGKWENPTD